MTTGIDMTMANDLPLRRGRVPFGIFAPDSDPMVIPERLSRVIPDRPSVHNTLLRHAPAPELDGFVPVAVEHYELSSRWL